MTVEVVSPFRKSSYSAQSNDCVELARTSVGGHAVRDTKHSSGPVQFHGPDAWSRFLTALKSGDLPTT
ncbi:DUF397 domain-containing protein [Streptomyces roseirectus]|uniref:DUF397 domain-containing protein n=1 Tax=Streptomyces roseirectus TaxID=2768066 RepID=A0A7H0IJZ6_9ACTN|nr:DUF397 domain-containing protein [Streptomyces roseirectus]QNP73112.1 DUF397 domain-containing protein [Streptomyces roseirectus]